MLYLYATLGSSQEIWTNTHDFDSLTAYVLYIKELYTFLSQSHTSQSQHWTHLPRCEFVQLAMISNKRIRRGGPEEEMVRLAQQGKIETIMSFKTSIELGTLFFPPLVVLPPPPSRRLILIEGAPGGGKSTLALHICYKWSQDSVFMARFDMVVLAYLRDQEVQNAKTLADILPADTKILYKMIASKIQATCGKMCFLFLMDGMNFHLNCRKSHLYQQ